MMIRNNSEPILDFFVDTGYAWGDGTQLNRSNLFNILDYYTIIFE